MAAEVTVPGNTILELVEYWGSTPDNETKAFVSINIDSCKRAISRKQVLDCSKRFAYRLNNFDIQKGHIVCNALPNSLERVVCEFGIQFSGAASMNGQILRSDAEDFLEALRTSQCVAVIVDPNVPNSVYNVLLKKLQIGCEASVNCEQLPHLRRLILCTRDDANSHDDFMTSLSNPDLPQFQADVYPSDLATIMTTSGSTGYSKLVKMSHANICHFCKQVKGIEPLSSGAHFVNCAPLGWAGGYPQWYLSCGVTRHFIDMHDGPPPDIPALLWRIMVQEKIVYGFLTPMFVNAILTKSPWQTAEWKPKILCLAGQPVKKGQLDIIGRLCDAVDLNYGMTECNLVSTHRIVDPSNYTDGCAGYPGYGVKVKVVDVNRQDVPQGSTGEILVRSPSLCSGYLNNESARNSAFTSDGWFCTDDAGYVGLDGKLYVEGRQSDSILRGAYILYPGWLEKKMRELPDVKDIAIVAVPDMVLCNEICACVVVSDVKGIVAGCFDGTESKISSNSAPSLGMHHLEDDVDKVAFIENVYRPFSSNLYDSKSKLTNSNSTSASGTNNDKILQKDGIKPPSFLHNETKKTCEDSSSKQTTGMNLPSNTVTKASSAKNCSLISLEKELRRFANDLNMLPDKDAMRMVPKYYVFMDSFPLTGTGKVSRKEIRKMAASILGLE